MTPEEPVTTAGTPTRARGLGTGPTLLVALAVLTVAMNGVRNIGSLVGPVFLALTLALAVRPATEWLRARRVPAAPLWVLIGLYAVLLAMGIAMAAAMGSLATKLPTYETQFRNLYDSALQWLAGLGVSADDVATALRKFDLTSLVGVAQTVLSGLTATSSQLVTMVLALAFISVDTADVRLRGARLAAARPHLAAALSDFAWRVRKYWVVSTVFGLICAAIDWGALVLLGVPLAFTWAVLAFVTNYIPNVGFFIALIPAALLALLDSGPGTALAVVIAYMVINFVVQTLIQPRFVGEAVGLGTTVTFLSLLFWSGVIGAMGAVLAVPLTLFVRAMVVTSTPRLAWLDVFFQSSDDPPKPAASH